MKLYKVVHFSLEAQRRRSPEFVWTALCMTFCTVLWLDAQLSNFFSIFSVPGTSDSFLLIFPTHEVGISLEGHDGDTGV